MPRVQLGPDRLNNKGKYSINPEYLNIFFTKAEQFAHRGKTQKQNMFYGTFTGSTDTDNCCFQFIVKRIS